MTPRNAADNLYDWLTEAITQLRVMTDIADHALLRLSDHEDVEYDHWRVVADAERWGKGIEVDAMDCRDVLIKAHPKALEE